MILLYECYVIILSKVEETKSVKEIFCVSSESDSGPDLVDQKIEKSISVLVNRREPKDRGLRVYKCEAYTF